MVATVVAGLVVGRPSLAFGQAVDPGPSQAAAASSSPSPTSFTPQYHQRWGLVIGGLATFGLSYSLALFGGIGASSEVINGPNCKCSSQFGLWAIPVVGPMVGNAAAAPGSGVGTWPAVALSAVEAAGVTMFVVGLIGHDVPVAVVPTVTRQLSALSLNFNW
jgi:hypothetical protein